LILKKIKERSMIIIRTFLVPRNNIENYQFEKKKNTDVRRY